MAVIKISILICPTWISLWKIWKIGTRLRIHFGSGSTFSKCGSEDPDPLLRKGKSENPDPLFPNVDPKIRIHVKMRWIRNADFLCTSQHYYEWWTWLKIHVERTACTFEFKHRVSSDYYTIGCYNPNDQQGISVNI